MMGSPLPLCPVTLEDVVHLAKAATDAADHSDELELEPAIKHYSGFNLAHSDY
jgi:hypothetical protein